MPDDRDEDRSLGECVDAWGEDLDEVSHLLDELADLDELGEDADDDSIADKLQEAAERCEAVAAGLRARLARDFVVVGATDDEPDDNDD